MNELNGLEIKDKKLKLFRHLKPCKWMVVLCETTSHFGCLIYIYIICVYSHSGLAIVQGQRIFNTMKHKYFITDPMIEHYTHVHGKSPNEHVRAGYLKAKPIMAFLRILLLASNECWSENTRIRALRFRSYMLL